MSLTAASGRPARGRLRAALRAAPVSVVAALGVCFLLVTPGAEPVPTATAASVGGLPQGNWESASAVGPTIAARGWALDPDAKTSAVSVHVYVDGRWGGAVNATASRPDVGAAFPGAGNAHGWSYTQSVAAGQHQVCVYAIDVQDASRNTPLGCRKVAVQITTPLGNLETVSSEGTRLTAGGWSMDPDSPTTPVTVHVYVDGQWGGAVTANATRPDVGAAFPGTGNAHGWSYSATVSRGQHSVCMYAIDVENPARNTPLGCRFRSVGVTLPVGNWDGSSVSGADVAMWGWALDPDSLAAGVDIRVWLDGVESAATGATSSRPDVRAAFPGAGEAHGWSLTLTLSPGSHSLCVYAPDLEDSSRRSSLGCRTVAVQVAVPRASWDSLSASDAGVSAWGWALDTDAKTSPVSVDVYVDGGWGAAVTANGSRPDIGAAFPGAGNAHGWSYAVWLPPGSHTLCVYAIDIQIPSHNTPLGCRTVTMPAESPQHAIQTAYTASGAEYRPARPAGRAGRGRPGTRRVRPALRARGDLLDRHDARPRGPRRRHRGRVGEPRRGSRRARLPDR